MTETHEYTGVQCRWESNVNVRDSLCKINIYIYTAVNRNFGHMDDSDFHWVSIRLFSGGGCIVNNF